MVEESLLHPHGITVVEGSGGSSTSLLPPPPHHREYKVVPVARATTTTQLAKWIEDHHLLPLLYDKKTWHDELVERSTEIIGE